ncbi:helix-turn-helix domain-containing protein [Flavobacteriaceae bacterium]|uniref:helix-turn-helix domain-containing protein n=1 Tax=Candidatus Arcticimaribacter forsetii TaxID=2820661 RepID=UPI0020773875|nr:helix-turn-helix transcriptional regulator [Candidatus Arcticimaribacter forsetii]MDB2325496.1 helix-turn-helix domain-containing protein [Flavobacteriaceae bacterium]MDB2346051.1 helix-turn-helix domain-containing protein [Flavobacteriaceae bacterium]MDB4738436.1 helix-turn-helix domain-containing protein [Flavobacteriaceae bacterium]MDB4752023.1 helix-turn-helix domain-containing protein [Flavobacteriaceae bacterium]
MLNYEGIVLRIKKIIENNELNAASFAEKIGVQRSGISHILSGRNKPSLEFLSKIQHTFKEVEYDWLLLGIENSKKEAPTLFSEKIEPQVQSDSIIDDGSIKKQIEPLSQNLDDAQEINKIIFIYTDGSFKIIDKKY